jgi:hypothetical protein
MTVTAVAVYDIISKSKLNLDAYGWSYFYHLQAAEDEYGEDGVKHQINYILNNCGPATTEAQKEAKKQLKKMAK